MLENNRELVKKIDEAELHAIEVAEGHGGLFTSRVDPTVDVEPDEDRQEPSRSTDDFDLGSWTEDEADTDVLRRFPRS